MAGYIRAEPDALRRTLAESPGRVREVLTSTGRSFDRIHLVGSGTSHFAAQAAADEFRFLTGWPVDVHLPSDFLHYVDDERITDRSLVIAVSQSGRSTGTRAAIRRARLCGATTVLVTGDAVVSDADAILDIGSGPETVGAKTKGFVCTVAALLLLARGLGGRPDGDDLAGLPSLIEAVIESSAAPLAAFFPHSAPVSLSVLSYGPNMSTAREGALKILEAALIPVEALDVEEFLHGPHRRLSSESGIVLIAPDGPMLARAQALVAFATRVGASVLTISDTPDATITIPVRERLGPLVYVVPLQLLAVELAGRLGRSPEDIVFEGFHEQLDSKIGERR